MGAGVPGAAECGGLKNQHGGDGHSVIHLGYERKWRPRT